MTSARAAALFAQPHPGRVPKPGEVSMAAPLVSSSSSSSSSESSSDSSDSSVQRAGSVGDVPWVLPQGGKLHGRVDFPGGGACRLCRPERRLKPGFQKGNSSTEATATKADWCKDCRKTMLDSQSEAG